MTIALHRSPKPQRTDVFVEAHGNIVLFWPRTDIALDWLRDNTDADGWQWLGSQLAVDVRCAEPLVTGLIEAGFEVR